MYETFIQYYRKYILSTLYYQHVFIILLYKYNIQYISLRITSLLIFINITV